MRSSLMRNLEGEMTNELSDPLQERTFQYQDSLPPLPVPSLEGSLSKYLDAVRPFATEPEYEATVENVRSFQEGIGQVLQQKLLHRASTRRNWLEEWWLNTAYLEVRTPSQLNVNFGGPAPYLEHCWPPAEGTQLQRNSVGLWYTLQYWDLIRTERMAPHKAGRSGLDMDQYRMLFCTCKVPGVTKDTILNYFKTESEGPCPSHVVVLRRGRIFTFDALHDGKILSPPELLRQLQYVTECCEGGPEGDGVAALTSEERTTWAKAREHLISLDPVNTSILETIQSSLFVVSLDEAKPYATAEDYTPLTLAALAGDPTIRWGDKSYNSISYADGTFGCNCDHAPYDGMIMVSLSYYIDCRLRASGGKWKGSDMVRDISLPEELLFRLDDRVRHDVQLAKQHFLETANNLQVVCCAFTSFGKYAIKQRKLHPDTFVQLAMQLAYYRKHGRPGSCYETAMTRRFYHGRTETMRPCTQEAVLWCQAMTDPTCTEDVKRKALLKAFNKHNKLMALAQNGEGFDRHLLGLYLVAKEEGLPTPHLFRDPLYAKSGGGGNFVLSSSLVGYQTVVGVGAPMVLHGYGCFYNIRDDRIVMSITAWKADPQTDAESLFQNLCSSLHDILQAATTSQL
ncbi:peroxisomal carnitine O-octanoyltransferase-like isoform X3 [Gadus macrocephalus]|uniref:peroxisomal carnitine O-octanoyltransferase-like isoform X3 n=1 Tax=Gadus macrocephalus TaxID=80720 RepID=UPI0028CB66B8|nr:peroxisomal carnitine O-octanoyltransferase-like isoform X3 [Gadus macrocephalus]